MTEQSPRDVPATAGLVAQLRRRERWLLALAAARSVMLSGASIAEAMDLIADRSASLTEADATLILLDDGVGSLRVAAVAGPAAAINAGPTSGPVLSATDPWAAAIRPVIGNFSAAGFPSPEHPGLREIWQEADSVLIAPIPTGRPGVVICLRRAGREPFTPDQQPELVGLAEQAAIAIDVAARQEHERTMEVVADRERIARDLHDHVIQRLYAIGLGLQATRRAVTDSRTSTRIDDAASQIDEAISDLRSSIFDLRADPAAARRSLRRRLTEMSSPDTVPRVTVRCDGPVDTLIPRDIAEHVEAVVREAISNAVRHAHARTVTATIAVSDEVRVTVTDDGVGIPPNAAHSGLVNLAARARSCRGTFRARGDGTGTVVEWIAPLPAEQEDI